MRLWRNRPLFAVTCTFMGTALLGFFLLPWAKALMATLGLLWAVLWVTVGLIRRKRIGGSLPTRGILAVCLLLCMSTAMLQSLWAIDRAETKVKTYEGESCEVVGTVIECRSRGGQMSTYVLEVSSVNKASISYRALLTCYYIADFKPGYELLLTADAVPLTEATGDIYEEYLLMGDGIFGGLVSMTENDYTVLREEPETLTLTLARYRHALSAELEQLFGEEAAGLPSALLLGERGYLEDDTKRDFERTGVSHLLAISGLHMTLIFGMLALILKLLRLSPRVRAVILGVTAAVYLVLLGFPPSATRAIIMLGMTYLASLCFAQADPLTSLGLAGACILLISPTTVADVGFWMSFSATLGLLSVHSLTVKPINGKQKCGWLRKLLAQGGRKLASGLGTGIVAMTFSLWIVTPVMGETSLLSAPMTLLLTPLVGLLLLLVPLALLTSSTIVGPLLVTAVRAVADAITELCAVCAKPAWVTISLRDTVYSLIAVGIIALTLLLLGLSLKHKWTVLVPMAAGWLAIFAIWGVQYSKATQDLQVSYLIPSSTSEVLVMTRGREAVICELSNGSRTSLLTAAEEASAQGATEISALVLTDYHSRTSSALARLLRRETVRALWMPRPTNEEDYYLMLACLEAAEQTETPAVIYDHGDELTLFGAATLTLERTELERSVQPVLLLTLETPTDTMTLCGRSILESELVLPALLRMAESDTVILSNRGPVLKAPMDCVFGPETKTVYMANETVAAHLSPACYPREDMITVIGQGRWRMTLSDDTE